MTRSWQQSSGELRTLDTKIMSLSDDTHLPCEIRNASELRRFYNEEVEYAELYEQSALEDGRELRRRAAVLLATDVGRRWFIHKGDRGDQSTVVMAAENRSDRWKMVRSRRFSNKVVDFVKAGENDYASFFEN